MIADYLQLTKPRITWLILASTAIGFCFGAAGGWQFSVLIHTLLGTGFIASGTATLNQWWERTGDARMKRTAGRPLAAFRLDPAKALIFGIVLSVIGFIELWLGANLLTAVLGLFTLTTYLFIYTPLKTRTWHATTIGAIPGAMPPLIGYAAAFGGLTPEAWSLFAILFLWQFPHFYAIAWMYREDYALAGIRFLSVEDPTGDRTVRQILITSIALIPISLLPRYLGMSGDIYFIGAVLLGLMYLYSGFLVAQKRSERTARKVLLASIVYLPALYAIMLADRTRM